MSRYYLGLSTSGHDPAFSIVDSRGVVLFAEATERFLQDKRAWGILPDHVNHLEAALAAVIDDADAEYVVATSWKSVKEELPVQVCDALLPAAFGEWIRQLQGYSQTRAGIHCRLLLGERMQQPIRHFDHHQCHAANALYSSPFADGLCLVLDGEGEVGAASLFEARDGRLQRLWRSWGPGSLGALYGWLTELCGFSSRHGEEWKVMGLAACGEADQVLAEKIGSLLVIEEGRLRLAQSETLQARISEIRRHAMTSKAPLSSRAMLASTSQLVFQTLADQLLDTIRRQHPAQSDRLILTGGCALNSLYNGSIQHRHGFAAVHVPSAPADDGNAVGAALLAWGQDHPEQGLPHGHTSAYLGATIRPADVEALARYSGLHCLTLGEDSAGFVAQRLAEGKVIGVARGRAEFGPRALGNRSILADPRNPAMKARINGIVKEREAYRPFAPAIPLELADAWFEQAQPSPYMSFALTWREQVRERVPAVVHQDGTGRLQTVDPQVAPWLHALLQAFHQVAGVPVILNTSFNVMGKPIVHTAHDAIAVLMSTDLDAVLLNDTYIEKTRR